MRQRARVAKADSAAAAKVSRLTDIEVHEVSIVDKPANKRQFLVVKSAGGDDEEKPSDPPPPPAPPTDPPPADPPPAAPVVKMKAAEKKRIAATIKAIVDAAGAVTKVLEGAAEADDAATPAELTKALEALDVVLKQRCPSCGEANIVDGRCPVCSYRAKKDESGSDDVTKAGRKISTARLAVLRQSHELLGALIAEVDDATADEPPKTEAEKAEKAAKAAAPAGPQTDPALLEGLREIATTVGLIAKATKVQKERIDAIESGGRGVSRQTSIEKSDEQPATSVSWPLDMNRRIERGNTPVEKSFFPELHQ